MLGAFLLGTLAPSTSERDVFAGMLVGLVLMAVIWWATPIAWTWYVLIGSLSTVIVALASARIRPAAIIGAHA